jgi:prolipoprotein diacylglyceryltransferase
MGGFLVGYAALRALTEVFRGDLERGAFGVLSTSQLLSIPLGAIGLWILRTGPGRAARVAWVDAIAGGSRADDATT